MAKIDNETSQNMADTTKALADHVGGPVGNTVSKLGNTGLGNDYLNFSSRMAMKNPMMKGFDKLSNAAVRSGAVKGKNSPKGDDGDDSENPLDSLNNKKGKSKDDGSISDGGSADSPSGGIGGDGGLTGGNDAKTGDVTSTVNMKIPAKVKVMIITGALNLLWPVFVAIVIITAIYSVGDAFGKYASGNSIFFSDDQEELETEYYEELIKVQKDRFKDEHVCVDANLITATLIVESTFEPDANGYVTSVLGPKDPEANTSPDGKAGALDYKRMKKQVELLANMQIKHIRSGWDLSSDMTVVNGERRCKPHTEETSYELVNSHNWQRFDFDGVFADLLEKDSLGANGMDSSSPELVARHDITGFAAFFMKAYDQEKNYEYLLYQPAAEWKCLPEGNPNCTYKEVCEAELDEEKAELSIGDDSDPLNTMENGVFYWNLVNSFISEYYKDYLPAEDDEEKAEERERLIHELADSIYVLYKTMGPSHDCSAYKKKNNDDGDDTQYGDSELCPDGVTVRTKEGLVTVPLEEYVAGVVSHEAYINEGMEALKAQAVAARTYVLNYTNGCQGTIGNDDRSQAYSKNIKPRARQAAKETEGEVMHYNGKVFSAMYDSFCIDDGDCPDSKTKSPNADGSYTVTYHKMPALETNVITLTDSAQYPRFVPGGGHAKGMSQLMSYQLAKEGKDYHQILSYFYSDGVTYYVGGGKAGPWDKWKQCDKNWGSELIDTKSICEVGCALTSVAIQIARSGVPTILDPNFNPGTFMKAHRERGGFVRCKGGAKNCISWDVSKIAPGFNYAGSVGFTGMDQVRSLMSQGYYVIANVKDGGHYVAVIGTVGDNIAIADPGWNINTLNEYAGGIVTLVLYKVNESQVMQRPPEDDWEEEPEEPPSPNPGAFISSQYNGMNYYLYSPKDTSSNKPLIVYLHGDGGGGTSKSRIKGDGGTNFMGLIEDSGYNYDAYILMPQSRAANPAVWNTGEIMGLIRMVASHAHVDTSKISIWGYSRGTQGVHNLVNGYPGFFNSAVLIADYWGTTTNFENLPTYGLVGKLDDSGAYDATRNFITNLNNLGNGNAYFKDYDGYGHGGMPGAVIKDSSISLVNWAISQ